MTHVRTSNPYGGGDFPFRTNNTSGGSGFSSRTSNTPGRGGFPYSNFSKQVWEDEFGVKTGPFCGFSFGGTNNTSKRRPGPDLLERLRQEAERAVERVAKEQQRQENARREREARRTEQREAAEREAAAQEKGADTERAEQDARWVRFRATTALDKQNACLHSQFDGWVKTTHQRKPKCESCSVKRSMTTFTCPYCELMVCQKCRIDLAQQKREMAEKK